MFIVVLTIKNSNNFALSFLIRLLPVDLVANESLSDPSVVIESVNRRLLIGCRPNVSR